MKIAFEEKKNDAEGMIAVKTSELNGLIGVNIVATTRGDALVAEKYQVIQMNARVVRNITVADHGPVQDHPESTSTRSIAILTAGGPLQRHPPLK